MTKKLEELFDLPEANAPDLTQEENSSVVESSTAKDIRTANSTRQCR